MPSSDLLDELLADNDTAEPELEDDEEIRTPAVEISCGARSVLMPKSDFQLLLDIVGFHTSGIVGGEFTTAYLGVLITAAKQCGLIEIARTLSRVKLVGAAIYKVRERNVKPHD